MITFFNYCFYRYAKFYKKWGDNGPYVMAFGLLFLAIALYLSSIINFLLYQVGIEYTDQINIGIAVFCCFLDFIFSILMDSEGRYKKLEKKYKNEDNVKLKGWGVGLFILFAFLCYIASLLIFKTV